MQQTVLRASIVFALGLVGLSAVAPATSQTATYMTTGLVQSGIKQSTIGGYNGVLVNYTSSYSSSFTALVYMDVINSLGQSVSWSVVTCSFSANQKVACFVVASSAIPTGMYTANVFATTSSSVPVSVTSSLPVSF